MCLYIETLSIENEQIANLSYHNKRMNETRHLLLGCSDKLDLGDHINPYFHIQRTKCRVEYARTIGQVSYTPYRIKPVNLLRTVVANELDYSHKRTDRTEIDALFALRGEADDILIVRNGFLTDTSICNIALWNGSYWLTPSSPLLKGVRRASLIDEKIILPSPIRLADIRYFHRIRLFNSLIGFGEVELPVSKITLI